MRCCYDGTALLTPDGYYSMCCSFCSPSIPALRIGHMSEMTFSQLEKRVLADDAFFIILRDGFGWFMRQLHGHGFAEQRIVYKGNRYEENGKSYESR